jgi:hypothetical protein
MGLYRSRVALAAALLAGALCPPVSAAGLHVLEPAADAGEVRSGAPLAHRFAFINEGPAPVVLTEVRAGCGCLTPRLEPAGTALPHAYLPGERGALLLDVNTLDQNPGPHTWHVTVRYRTTDEDHEADLQLSGRVVTEVAVRPAALTLFADAAVGHEIVLTDLRSHPLAVTAVRGSAPQVRARVAEQSRDAAGHWVCRIGLEVADGYPEGRHEEVLDIFTDDPAYPDLRVPLTIVRRGRRRLSAAPDPVTLSAGPGQETPARLVLVRDRDGQPVVIDHVDADDPAVSCRWSQGPGGPAAVKVRVDPARLAGGDWRSAIHIHVSKPVAATLTVPVAVDPR